MRKSFDGLCGIVRSELDADPLSGSLFVFCNRRRTMVKVLYWATDGFAIWYQKTGTGPLHPPPYDFSSGRIDRRQLAMLLEGVVPKKVSKRYYFQ